MLTATAFGATQVVAAFLWAMLDGTYAHATRLSYASAGLLVAVHLVFAPLTLPLRYLDLHALERVTVNADKTLPQGEEAKNKTLVLVNPPMAVFPAYILVLRGARDRTQPEHLRWLATAESDLLVTRVDTNSVTLAPAGGFLTTGNQVMFRRADRKLVLDQEIRLEGVTYKVVALTDDGRPARILVHFDRALESPEFAWRVWGKHDFLPFTPPAVGQSVVLPKAELGSLLQDPHAS